MLPDMPSVPGMVAVDRASPLWRQTVQEVVEDFARRREAIEKKTDPSEEAET